MATVKATRWLNPILIFYPDKTPVDWTALSAQEIFEEGKYLEHYK